MLSDRGCLAEHVINLLDYNFVSIYAVGKMIKFQEEDIAEI